MQYTPSLSLSLSVKPLSFDLFLFSITHFEHFISLTHKLTLFSLSQLHTLLWPLETIHFYHLSLSHTHPIWLFSSLTYTQSLSLSRSLRLSLSSYFSLLQTLTLLSLSLKHTCIHSISNKQSIGISLSSQCSHSSISLTHAALSLSHSNTLYLSFSRGQTPFSYPYT